MKRSATTSNHINFVENIWLIDESQTCSSDIHVALLGANLCGAWLVHKPWKHYSIFYHFLSTQQTLRGQGAEGTMIDSKTFRAEDQAINRQLCIPWGH
ncbi:hypothetical protein DD237_005008 [Peronospora effusa]|uniref:Uncharacterized protein n=1 Tax=Peronospora effusa TaxID=542832 RepID=A0A425CDB7_9STRA|nr:hypothetical protein DD237_005008 [Peronospora effusa]